MVLQLLQELIATRKALILRLPQMEHTQREQTVRLRVQLHMLKAIGLKQQEDTPILKAFILKLQDKLLTQKDALQQKMNMHTQKVI